MCHSRAAVKSFSHLQGLVVLLSARETRRPRNANLWSKFSRFTLYRDQRHCNWKWSISEWFAQSLRTFWDSLYDPVLLFWLLQGQLLKSWLCFWGLCQICRILPFKTVSVTGMVCSKVSWESARPPGRWDAKTQNLGATIESYIETYQDISSLFVSVYDFFLPCLTHWQDLPGFVKPTALCNLRSLSRQSQRHLLHHWRLTMESEPYRIAETKIFWCCGSKVIFAVQQGYSI